MGRDEITDQLVALADYRGFSPFAEGAAAVARWLVHGDLHPALRHVLDAATTDPQESPWAEVLPKGTTMADETRASETRNSGDEFQAEWIAAELERNS